MPYIPEYERDSTDTSLGPNSVGQLTYVLYKTCVDYLEEPARFADYAEVLGALEATKLELYRCRIAPYEDEKIKENGDIE